MGSQVLSRVWCSGLVAFLTLVSPYPRAWHLDGCDADLQMSFWHTTDHICFVAVFCSLLFELLRITVFRSWLRICRPPLLISLWPLWPFSEAWGFTPCHTRAWDD